MQVVFRYCFAHLYFGIVGYSLPQFLRAKNRFNLPARTCEHHGSRGQDTQAEAASLLRVMPEPSSAVAGFPTQSVYHGEVSQR